jgi:GNAT superfamily N-acetyltransferase
MNTGIQILQANLSNPNHAQDLIKLLNHYAMDIMGGGEQLSEDVNRRLIPELQKRPDAIVLLAYDQKQAAGLSISFEGFSTFYAKPLINLHDLVVAESHRGQGIARKILEKIEQIARARGCCKLTLEVLEGNIRAQKVYKEFGFASYQLHEQAGRALFLDKKLI